MKWEIALANWRRDRSITEPQSTYKSMMLEEDEELNDAISTKDEHEIIDSYADQLVVTTNQIALECTNGTYPELLEFNSLYDALKTYQFGLNNSAVLPWIDTYLRNQIEERGYIVDLVMKQVVKEISSRKQDPEQAALWASQGGNINGDKWQKNKNQDPDTLYKADYSKCKSRKRK